MLEFVLVFPFAMAIIMFTIDVARVYMAVNATQYAAEVAAKAGALYGAAGRQPSATQAATSQCAGRTGTGPVDNTAIVLDTFCKKLASVPGGQFAMSSIKQLTITGGTNSVAAPRRCLRTEPYVSVRTRISIPTLTPGISALIGGSGGNVTWNVTTKNTALCEVIPQAP